MHYCTEIDKINDNVNMRKVEIREMKVYRYRVKEMFSRGQLNCNNVGGWISDEYVL